MVDNVSADPLADRDCYKRGDPVVVMPDGHPWGRKEGTPNFVVLKILGVNDRDLVEPLLDPERSEFVFNPDDPTEGVPVRRRAYHFDLSTFAARTVQNMERDGEITLTRASAESRLVNKRTGERAITAEVR